jgi:hypothetical protein
MSRNTITRAAIVSAAAGLLASGAFAADPPSSHGARHSTFCQEKVNAEATGRGGNACAAPGHACGARPGKTTSTSGRACRAKAALPPAGK